MPSKTRPSDPPWQEAGGQAFLPSPDQTWQRAPVPITARYEVVGLLLEFATNAPILADLAAETFESKAKSDPASGASGVRLECLLHDVPESWDAGHPPAPLFRARGEYLFLTIGASFGFGDRAKGTATAFVAPALLREPLLVQAGLMETLALFLVHPHRPATLHAAGLVSGDRCVLLAGSNGAGKSTLAYACLRAGFDLLAEDVVYAEALPGHVQARGNPWRIHLMPDVVRFFPELAAARRVQMLNGETKLRIRVEAVRPGAAVSQSPVWGVLSLGRAPGAESYLCPADLAVVRRSLTHFAGGPTVYEAAVQAAADRLLRGRVAHLEVGSDLDQAVALVKLWADG